MTKRAIWLVALLVAVPLTGCIENIGDLRDRIAGTQTQNTNNGNPLDQVKDPAKNATNVLNPVARITIFVDGGAMLYKSSFEAHDVDFKDAAIPAGTTIRFVGSDSAATDLNASVKVYEWAFGDGKTAKGATVTHAYGGAGGVYTVALKVTDSKNRVDSQKIKVAVRPSLVNTTEPFEGAIQAGTAGVNAEQLRAVNTATFAFAILASDGSRDLQHVRTTLTLAPKNQQAVNLDLRVVNATGEALGESAGGSSNEVVVLEGLEAQELVAEVTGAIAANGEFTLVIVSEYQPVNHTVEGYLGGGGHQH